MSDRDMARGMEYRNVVVPACHTALNLRRAVCVIPQRRGEPSHQSADRWDDSVATSKATMPSPSMKRCTTARVCRGRQKSGGTARVRLRVVGGTSWPIFLLEEQSLDSAMLLSKASDR